jgi:hypothetical protein
MWYPALAGPGLNFEHPSKYPVKTPPAGIGPKIGDGVYPSRKVGIYGVKV